MAPLTLPALLLLLILPASPSAVQGASFEPPGFRPRSPGIHALTNARVHIHPGLVLTHATLVLSNQFILSVTAPAEGSRTADLPPGAQTWDGSRLTVYPGFIDPYVTLPGEAKPPATDAPAPSLSRSTSDADTDSGGNSRGRNATASDVAEGPRFFGVAGGDRDPGLPGPGAGSRDVTPERRLSLSYAADGKILESLRELGFASAQFVPGHGIFRGQAVVVNLGDASPGTSVLQADSALCVALDVPNTPRSRDAYPDSLMGVIATVRQTFLDAAFHAEVRDFYQRNPGSSPRPIVNSALDALQAARHGQRVIWEPGSVLMIDRAARIAAEFGLTRNAFVASGQEWRRADLMPGGGATFIVPLTFPALPKFPEDEAWDTVQLDSLRAWDWAPENPAVLRRGRADVALTTQGLSDRKEFRKNLKRALERGLSEEDALAALTTVPARVCGLEERLGTLEAGKWANLTVVEGSYFDPAARVHSVWIDGVPYVLDPPIAPGAAKDSTATTNATTRLGSTSSPATNTAATTPAPRIARAPSADLGPAVRPPAVLIRDATIWTCGPEGVRTQASLLISEGRIQMVGGFKAKLAADTLVIDGTGLHVTPGIIDCHSHSMILGSVNEATLPSTAMVRIGDVVNSESPNIHLQLAGGVTTVNLLHGSANPIGGQNCVIKLREGAGPEGLKFTNAPPGIKFALGENVKQANWGERFTSRFPQSRMGVPAFHANRFEAARQYAAQRQAASSAPPGSPPIPPFRRDLELDALAEILEGSRLIHCHSYRQDEILAFLRTMESFGVRVATLQHILEGYKVADEIAQHGAGASAFADWWAYKYEVIDAIPYAGSLLHQRGVLVSFNSDSDDHARRLNLEAAKAVKYGGTPEIEALKFVTLNPARQLRIDRWVGSLEPGKDADVAIWSGHPLDTRSVCLQTWIEGRKYFDRSLEPARARALAEERQQLVEKARQSSKDQDSIDAKASDKARDRFFRRALERARHLGVAYCADCQLPYQP